MPTLGPEPVGAPLFIRGNPSHARSGRSGPGVPAFLADPDNPYEARPPLPGARSTGRRLALARWLTRPGSRPAALLARVLANRIWQHHFGTGLAATSDNLGYTGSPPTHPALLDFLAAELVRSGWSAKALHRLILNSAVWRQSSAPRPEAQAIDPDNRLLARFPLRRLDAEAIRDAMLAASGELDPPGRAVGADPADRRGRGRARGPGRRGPAPSGLPPAAQDPDRQPAGGLRRPLDRHHLHQAAARDGPAPIAQPAQLRLRGRPGREARRRGSSGSAPGR